MHGERKCAAAAAKIKFATDFRFKWKINERFHAQWACCSKQHRRSNKINKIDTTRIWLVERAWTRCLLSHKHTQRMGISWTKRQTTVLGCWFLHNKISLMRFKCQININNSVRQFSLEFVCFCRKLPIEICTIFQCSHTRLSAIVRVARGDISLPDIIISNIKQLNSMWISKCFSTCCIIHNPPLLSPLPFSGSFRRCNFSDSLEESPLHYTCVRIHCVAAVHRVHHNVSLHVLSHVQVASDSVVLLFGQLCNRFDRADSCSERCALWIPLCTHRTIMFPINCSHNFIASHSVQMQLRMRLRSSTNPPRSSCSCTCSRTEHTRTQKPVHFDIDIIRYVERRVPVPSKLALKNYIHVVAYAIFFPPWIFMWLLLASVSPANWLRIRTYRLKFMHTRPDHSPKKQFKATIARLQNVLFMNSYISDLDMCDKLLKNPIFYDKNQLL